MSLFIDASQQAKNYEEIAQFYVSIHESCAGYKDSLITRALLRLERTMNLFGGRGGGGGEGREEEREGRERGGGRGGKGQ